MPSDHSTQCSHWTESTAKLYHSLAGGNPNKDWSIYSISKKINEFKLQEEIKPIITWKEKLSMNNQSTLRGKTILLLSPALL